MSSWTEADVGIDWVGGSEPTRAPIGPSFRPDVVFESVDAQLASSEPTTHPGFILAVEQPLVGRTRETVQFYSSYEPPYVEGATFHIVRGIARVGHGRILAVRERVNEVVGE